MDLLREAYDIIIIDTQPSLRLLTGNALAACTHYIIPIETSSQYPLYGVSDLMAYITKIKAILKAPIRVGQLYEPRLFVSKSGKTIGRLENDDKKITLTLASNVLDGEKEQALSEFISSLIDDQKVE